MIFQNESYSERQQRNRVISVCSPAYLEEIWKDSIHGEKKGQTAQELHVPAALLGVLEKPCRNAVTAKATACDASVISLHFEVQAFSVSLGM